jgi:hypothetical protein
VALGVIALVALQIWLGPRALRADQDAYDLLVAKRLEPALFERDVLYRYDPDLLHVPLFIRAHAAVARATGTSPEDALVWLAWPIGVLYLGGHYGLFRALTGSPLAAALATVSAMTVRNALGGEFWGFDGVPSVASRTILAGLTPLLLLAYVRWRARPSFPLFFLVLGVLFNLHPVSAYHLAQITGLAHVVTARARLRALRDVALGAGLFAVGALPYVVRFFPARDNLPHADGLTRAALDYRFPYLLYPMDPAALISVALHLSLLAVAWLGWRRATPREAAERRTMVALEIVGATALVAAFVGLAVVQGLGVWLDRPYLDIQQLRMTRLLHPILLCGLALAYARLLARREWRARAAVAVLLALSLVPPGSVIHAVSRDTREALKARLVGREPPPARVRTAGDGGAVPALHAWVRAQTDPSDLFFTDDFAFRVRTRRSVTGSYKDGALLFLAGSRPFTAWYEHDRRVAACRAARGRDCWFALAREDDADYVVVDPRLSEVGAPSDFARAWSRSGVELWRRQR